MDAGDGVEAWPSDAAGGHGAMAGLWPRRGSRTLGVAAGLAWCAPADPTCFRIDLQRPPRCHRARGGVLRDITSTEGSYLLDWPFNECHRAASGQRTVREFKNPPGEGWRCYQNVADHLVKGMKLVITADWARRPIHILELAGWSAEKGAAVKAKYG